jgi:SAM-dependent methyltransferase
MNLINRLLENSLVYRLWQYPFVEQKLAPLRMRGEIARARRVLDVGCGPGTNTHVFASSDYLGIDINPNYIADARNRYGRRFVVADVTNYLGGDEGKFDFVFVNSMLHHIDDTGIRKLLSHLSSLVSQDGHVHILDLVLPDRQRSLSHMLARMDRGQFPRSVSNLRGLVDEVLEVVDFEAFPLTAGFLTLWSFVYFKARTRR